MDSPFWKNVSIYLEKTKMKPNQLAELSGIPLSTICSALEKKISNPRVNTAYQIAKGLNVSIEELYAGGEGAEFIRKLVKDDPRAIRVPERIQSIVECLPYLSNKELRGILAQVTELTADTDKRG